MFDSNKRKDEIERREIFHQSVIYQSFLLLFLRCLFSIYGVMLGIFVEQSGENRRDTRMTA